MEQPIAVKEVSVMQSALTSRTTELLLLLLLNVKIHVALSENASRTWYTIKIELKLRK